MNDPKAILQEYLINTRAPEEVLKAALEMDERYIRSNHRVQTAIKEQREMAETVIRAESGDYPVLAITPWLESLEQLVAYREAFWWMLSLYDSVEGLAEVGTSMIQDKTLSHQARKLIERSLMEDANCDHSVGICFCALHKALGLD